MRLLLIGPPGSGKGTQAVRIAGHYGIAHISSGDLLRRHVADGTTIGQTVAGCMRRGDLVPDTIVMDILRKPVEAAARRGGYILDGFPRTVAQAQAAYQIAGPLGAEVRIAVHITAGRAELIRRLLARGEQTGRTDDTEQVISHRLDVFDEAAGPLLDYYTQRETLITIDGDRPVSQVYDAAISRLDQVRQQLGIPAIPAPRDSAQHRPHASVSATTPARAAHSVLSTRRHTGPGRP